MIKLTGSAVMVLLAGSLGEAAARGVTPYLPLNLDPQIERQVERVLILADKPVMRRPIPAALVLDALPRACEVDALLCERVRRFLSNYMRVSGVAFASYEAAATSGSGGQTVLPNQHGATADSHYRAAAAGYLQPSDFLLVSVGGVADEGRAVATGSMLSAGFDFAQLDIGYRDHQWSPLTDSAMLIGTEAPTMPSITLSNYRPLTSFGLDYEVFVARMSHSKNIELTDGTLTSGYPKFGGLQLAIEPVSGWALGAQRILVWGGGAAGGQSFKDLLKAFFNPAKAQSTGFGTGRGTVHVVGKQEASVSSRFIFPGPTPFAVYFEYAGNDTVQGHNYLFGKPDLSGGVHFPRIGPFDITVEASQWEPSWYVHGFSNVQTGYGDGISNYRLSIGHWFGDQRVFGDAVGGRSNMVRIGWEPPFGGLLEAEYRMLVNDSYYSAIAYRHENLGSLSYAHPWKEYAVGAEIDVGRDVFGGRFTRFAGFLRYGDALRSGYQEAADESFSGERADGSEIHVDAGVLSSRVQEDVTGAARVTSPRGSGAHFGVGARRRVSEHQDLGVALEADDVRGRSLVSVRALDYRYRFDSPLALNFFVGASRYSANTPAFGYYLGAGPQWRDVLPGWDLEASYRYGVKTARLRVLPTEPQSGQSPNDYFNIYLWTLAVSRKF